jgi:hypothetical protein
MSFCTQIMLDRAANPALPTEEVTRIGLITIKPPGLEEGVEDGGVNQLGMGTLPEDAAV